MDLKENSGDNNNIGRLLWAGPRADSISTHGWCEAPAVSNRTFGAHFERSISDR